MRNKNKVGIKLIKEGVYDFYDAYEGQDTADKILNYYVDKIRKNGRDSLTREEINIFDNARKGKLTLENPVYKRNKLTGDIETDNSGNAIRLDKDKLYPGVPFVTSKGKGNKKKETINGRCYWDVDDPCKVYYIFSTTKINEENPTGLMIYRTHSKVGDKLFGTFIVPKSDIKNLQPDELWKIVNEKYDKGIILDKDMYLKFIKFDDLYHKSKKEFADELNKLFNDLKNYPE